MQITAFLPYRLSKLAAQVSDAISQVYAERFGLTRDEWRVLAAAGAAAAQPTREIAAQTGLDKVAISRAASGLEERGLISRSEDRTDRRIKILRLTEEGASLLAELDRIVTAREAYLLEGLDEAERALLDRMIDTLTERAAELAHPDAKGLCRPDCADQCAEAAEGVAATDGPGRPKQGKGGAPQGPSAAWSQIVAAE